MYIDIFQSYRSIFPISNVYLCSISIFFSEDPLFLFLFLLTLRTWHHVSQVEADSQKFGKKCEALRSVKWPNKEVPEKYGVHKNTISTWAKNKERHFTALGKSSNKRKKGRAT